MSEGVRPIDVVRAELDQLAAQLAMVERQIALLITAAILSLILMTVLLWRR